MSLQVKIQDAMKEAMRAKDETRLTAIRMIRSAMKNIEIEKRTDGAGSSSLDEKDVLAVLNRMKKQMTDSIEQFEKGDRKDLADRERDQLKVIEEFLPQMMGEKELLSVIDAAHTEVGATGMKDMGKLIKAVMAKTEGRADGKLDSDLVKKKLL